MSGDERTLAEFEAELSAVQAVLAAAADELGSPLGDLVQVQIKRTAPPIRAAHVLVVGYDPSGGEVQRSRRIHLAAALEMLYVALHVHRLLVEGADWMQSGDGSDLDKSFIGSTILAGDYCFSRAAAMAAQTDNPQVVAIFAQALQTVSEGQLRTFFDPAGVPFDEQRALLRSGTDAGIELAGLSSDEMAAYRTAGLDLANRLPQGSSPTLSLTVGLPHVDGRRSARWQALGQWLMGRRTNGRMSSHAPDRGQYN